MAHPRKPKGNELPPEKDYSSSEDEDTKKEFSRSEQFKPVDPNSPNIRRTSKPTPDFLNRGGTPLPPTNSPKDKKKLGSTPEDSPTFPSPKGGKK